MLIFISIILLINEPTESMPFESHLDLPVHYRSKRITRLETIPAHQTTTFLDIDTAGCITHIWATMHGGEGRDIIIRMYWDEETDPSVEAPIRDFFGIGHPQADRDHFENPCLTHTPNANGWNIYLPMPFARRARITITNDTDKPLTGGGGLYFQADYIEFDELPSHVPYFHAQWRREAQAFRRAHPYTIIEAVGSGFVAGMTYHLRVDDDSDGWYHAGGDHTFIDGQTDPYLIHGIGGEDYFGQSWGAVKHYTPYAGCTYKTQSTPGLPKEGRISFYRFYLESPIRFQESVRLAFGTLANEITSVGYWYQKEPHHRFFHLPPAEFRQSQSRIKPNSYDVELLPENQLNIAVIGPFAGNIDTVFIPEQEIKLATQMETNYTQGYKTGADKGTVRWEVAHTTLNWLDLDAIFYPKMIRYKGKKISLHGMPGSVYYAYIRLNAKEQLNRELLIGYDDPVRIWLNRKNIADLSAGYGFTSDKLKLTLKPGWNNLLIKCVNEWNENWGANAISLSFSDLSGIRLDNFSQLPPAPEYERTPPELEIIP